MKASARRGFGGELPADLQAIGRDHHEGGAQHQPADERRIRRGQGDRQHEADRLDQQADRIDAGQLEARHGEAPEIDRQGGADSGDQPGKELDAVAAACVARHGDEEGGGDHVAEAENP